jgi:flagellar biosynthesis protein FlhB
MIVAVAQRGISSRLSGSSGSAPRTERAGSRKSSHVVTTLVGYVRVALLACALVAELRTSLPGLLVAWQRSPAELVVLAAQVARALFLRAAVVLVALGALDLTVQQLLRLRRLRMTRRQVLEEQRELAGDPLWSGERRRQARSLAVSSTPLSAATIVVTGAACAAALRYVAGRDQVPVLWLKGEGLAAIELVRGAYALGLPLVSEPVVASALCRLEPWQAIPEALHASVAALLLATATAVAPVPA